MPQLSKKALACKRARAKRHSWAPTGVRGFEEKHPDPPAVRKRSYVVVERRLASAICVDSETQTSCPLLRDAATQTEFLASPQQTFIQQTLSATQQRVVELEEALETSRNTLWSASDTLCLPFLLPYSLMALLVLNLRNALHALFSHNTDFRKMFCITFARALILPNLHRSSASQWKLWKGQCNKNQEMCLLVMRYLKKRGNLEYIPRYSQMLEKSWTPLHPSEAGKCIVSSLAHSTIFMNNTLLWRAISIHGIPLYRIRHLLGRSWISRIITFTLKIIPTFVHFVEKRTSWSWYLR